MDEKTQQLLKVMDILVEDLSEQQKKGLAKFAKSLSDPSKITPNVAMKLVKDLKLDIKSLQQKSRILTGEKNVPKRSDKIGVNEQCPCGSGKKFKKCCMNE